MTAKYRGAIQLASAKLPPATFADWDNQSALYQKLGEHNYFWNSKVKAWEKGKTAAEPTGLVRIRVWAAAENVEQVAFDVQKELSHRNYQCLERSGPYPCRPPKQLESRIYLTMEMGGK